MSGTSITSEDYVGPGSLVVIGSVGGGEWMRVTATSGEGPFTCMLAPISAWERRRLKLRYALRRTRLVWLRRVWWPMAVWTLDRWEARRRR